MAMKQETAEKFPQIIELSEMPKAHRGRQGMDLTPIIEKLKDLKEHAFTGISDGKSKERWARKVREAANKAGLDVRTVYDAKNGRLAFQGYSVGDAPAQGRKRHVKKAS
jgi:hypothetical protein